MAGEMVYEEVPTFKRREGDVVMSGRNNATIVLGRDRTAGIDSGHGSEPGSGAISLVVGRDGEDPSLFGDSATLYLSMKSEPDRELDTSGNGTSSVAVVRADRVLIVPRDEAIVQVGRATLTMKSDGSIVIEGKVSLGKGAAERLIKESFGAVYASHVHSDPLGGFTGPPAGPVPDSVYSAVAKSL